MKVENFIKRFRNARASFGCMGQMMLEMELEAMSDATCDELKANVRAKPRLGDYQKNEMIDFIDQCRRRRIINKPA